MKKNHNSTKLKQELPEKAWTARIEQFEVMSVGLVHHTILECAIAAVPAPDCGQIVKADGNRNFPRLQNGGCL